MSRKKKGMDKKELKKFILLNIPYFILGYIADKVAFLMRTAEGDASDRIAFLVTNLGDAFKNPLPSIYPIDLLIGIAAALVLRLVMKEKKKNAKKFRHGTEYGSARWGTKADIDPFIDPEPRKNIILSATESLMCSFPGNNKLGEYAKPSHPKYARNKNVIVLGGSGSGKTRFFVKPNLMQMHSSYVITDSKGTILVECGRMLQKNGYKIKVFNTINFKRSMHYNPFAYIETEKDILSFVNTIIVNTKGEGKDSGEDFWVKAERLLLCAYVGYIHSELIEEEQNFVTLLDMINESETREDDESYKNAIDLIFEELEKKKPGSFAVRQYKRYKLAAGKTAKSILISAGARLAPFDIEELREMTSTDEMELDKMGTEFTALFVIISDTDDTFNFMVSILYTQMFNLLVSIADNVYNGKLPIHVRFLLDEFANIGLIPKWDKLIATIRSREISAAIILQAKSQLKTLYKDAADTIEGNCDTLVFLGGSEKTTLKDLSEMLGKETIDLFNTSDTRGQSPSYGTNYQKTGKELMSQDEIAVMDGGKCILRLRGVRPFLSDKYDITEHPQYRHLMDYNSKNEFNIENYIKSRGHLVVKPEMTVDAVFDLSSIHFTDVPEDGIMPPEEK